MHDSKNGCLDDGNGDIPDVPWQRRDVAINVRAARQQWFAWLQSGERWLLAAVRSDNKTERESRGRKENSEQISVSEEKKEKKMKKKGIVDSATQCICS